MPQRKAKHIVKLRNEQLGIDIYLALSQHGDKVHLDCVTEDGELRFAICEFSEEGIRRFVIPRDAGFDTDANGKIRVLN